MQKLNISTRLFTVAVLLYCMVFPVYLAAEGVVSPYIDPPPPADLFCGGSNDLSCFRAVKEDGFFEFGIGARYTLIKIALENDADPTRVPQIIIDLLDDDSRNTMARLDSSNANPNATPLSDGIPIYSSSGGTIVSRVLWQNASPTDKVYTIAIVHLNGGLPDGKQWQIKIKNNDEYTRKFYVGVANTTSNTWPLNTTIVEEATRSYLDLMRPVAPSIPAAPSNVEMSIP